MAYLVKNDEDLSMVDGLIGKSFLQSSDEDPRLMLQAPPNSFSVVRRNLMPDFDESNVLLLPPEPLINETVRVYLRVKPKMDNHTRLFEDDADIPPGLNPADDIDVISIESFNQVALTAPKCSNTYKNSFNGTAKICHRFAFSKIYPPDTDQAHLFADMVMPKLKQFIDGSNQLLFTYGATSSGKTFTIQGDNDQPGILPRSLDALFNSVGEQVNSALSLIPVGFNRVMQAKPSDVAKVEDVKQQIIRLGCDLCKLPDVSSSNSSSCSVQHQSLVSLLPHLNNRLREPSVVPLASIDSNQSFSIWVSFAEIYNENIFDLLEKIPDSMRTRKCGREPLKLAEDAAGNVYVRGLREVPVKSADEAYAVLMIGRENLHFAATRLNHMSSRSHCIFTIKLVRMSAEKAPRDTCVSLLSFCDLAGSERIKKTQNTGQRQKEACNINTSLLVLGRCIQIIRNNQMLKDAKKQQIVPYRDSKLTRLFQSFFTGVGKAAMVVNISQSPYLFDESLKVLNFAAIASKVHVEMSKEPSKAMNGQKKRRQSRFSIMVMSQKDSLLSGTGSIMWENPPIRSTMCPNGSEMVGTIIEEEDDDDDEDNDDDDDQEEEEITNGEPTKPEDQYYEGLMKVIEELKQNLIKEKQANLLLEAEVRAEMHNEYEQMYKKVLLDHEQRIQEERLRASELHNWRIEKMEEALQAKTLSQQQMLRDQSSTIKQRQQQLEAQITQKESEVQHLEGQLQVLKTYQDAIQEDNQRLKEDLSREASQNAICMKEISKLKAKLTTAEEQLTRQEKEMKKMRGFLDEAASDYLSEKEQTATLRAGLDQAKNAYATQGLQLEDLQGQVEQLSLQLSSAVTQMADKDSLIFELEEKVDQQQLRLQMLSDHDEEVERLQKEVKQLLKALSLSKEVTENVESEVKALTIELSNYKAKETLDKDLSITQLQLLVEANKKDQGAIEALRSELERRNKDKEDMQFSIDKLKHDLEAAEYDIKRTKEEKEHLMAHYEKTLSKLSDDLALEKRESSRIRQHLSIAPSLTPSKLHDQNKILKEELADKTKIIAELSSLIGANFSLDNLHKINRDSKLQLEPQHISHAAEMANQKKSYDKPVSELKSTSSKLQKSMRHTAKLSACDDIEGADSNTDHFRKSDQDDEVENKGRSYNLRKANSVAASFCEADIGSSADKKSRNRVVDASKEVGNAGRGKNKTESSVLKECNHEDAWNLSSMSMVTPSSRKKRLFTRTPHVEAFTPPEESSADSNVPLPEVIGQRKLRSRNKLSKK